MSATRALRVIPHVLLVIACATLLLMFKEWAYVATYRLYLDQRIDEAAASTARQRFDLGSPIVPRIVVRDERVSFRAAVGMDSTIRAEVSATGPGRFEIHVRRGGADALVAAGDVVGSASIVCPFPTGNGQIDIVSHGELAWSDLRLQRNLQLAPELWLLGVVLGCGLMWHRARLAAGWGPPAFAPNSRARAVWQSALTLSVSGALGLLVLEGGLRAAAHQLPNGISALRRDLGEPMADPRWQLSPRYGRRLGADVGGAPNEWRDGDIIRMGFVPPAMSERGIHRYEFRTDHDGFRNLATRDPIDVAALGDSFTDALTVAIDAAWPTQLEQRLGMVVQNYGTAGFGPQQERLVLEDFALKHHPRLVVLAFFAGNDIRDAERFEEFEQGDPTFTQETLGWPLKRIFTRADTWYLTSVIQAAASTLADTPAVPPVPGVAAPVAAPIAASASFNRGLFTVPVNGQVLRFALMPPYLNLLQFSAGELTARRGWTLTLENIRRMQALSNAAGARFVVMFVPFKSQVYLPLLDRAFRRDELARDLHFYLPDLPEPPDIDAFSRNRLAQNGLMQRFCEEAAIPFLDLTAVLQQRVEAGENMYFPDDSHLNEAGQALTAVTLASFLRQHELITARR